MKQYLTWEQTQYPIQWDQNPYTWEEVFVLIGIVQAAAGGGHKHHDAYKHLDQKEKDIVIRLVAKVKGKKYKNVKKKQQNIEVTASDIELVLKEVLQIQVNNID